MNDADRVSEEVGRAEVREPAAPGPWHAGPLRGPGALPGLYVISFALLMASFLCMLFYSQDSLPRWFCGSGAPFCFLLALGITFRVHLARFLLIMMLSFAVLLHCILVFTAILGWLPDRLPIVRTGVQISLTIWTLAYLLRSDVRRSFISDRMAVARPPVLPDQGEQPAGSAASVAGSDPRA